MKSIIDVSVNSSEFDRFRENFGKYTEKLKSMPGIWGESAAAQKDSTSELEKMVAAMLAVKEFDAEREAAAEKQTKHLTLSERLWVSMARSTKGVASNIGHATTALLRWSGLLSAVGGLLGAGGLWGIDRMAASASSQRSASMGLGLTPGELSAFRINFGSRGIDTGSMLGWVNEMETDVSKTGPAHAFLGHALSGDTSKDTIDLLQAIRAKGKSVPLSQLSTQLGAFGANMSPEQLRIITKLSDQEFGGMVSGFKRDSKSLNFDGAEWTKFTAQMERAGSQIFKTFVEGLAPLAPALSKLSEGFEKFISTLLKSDLAKDAIAKVATWFEEFSGEIASPEFLDKVRQFTSDMGGLADALHKLAHPIETTGNYIKGRIHQGDTEGYEQFLKGQAAQFGVPAALLDAQWKLESDRSFNGSMVNPKSGATGVFQFLPSTAKELGIDPTDTFQSGYGAAKYDAQLLKKYHGDIADVLAAYNMGTGNFDKVLAKHPNDWVNYVSPETKNYVAQGTRMTGSPGVLINVNNNTGGSATVSVSQLAPWGAVQH